MKRKSSKAAQLAQPKAPAKPKALDRSAYKLVATVTHRNWSSAPLTEKVEILEIAAKHYEQVSQQLRREAKHLHALIERAEAKSKKPQEEKAHEPAPSD